jgi:two-component system phosphate regulon sensor histidine kinase PhoR
MNPITTSAVAAAIAGSVALILATAGIDLALALIAAVAAGVGVAAGFVRARDMVARRRRILSATAESASSPQGGFQIGVGRALLELLPVGLVLVDRKGVTVYANPAAEELVERRLRGLPATAAIRAPALREALARAFESGDAADISLTLQRANERVVHAAVRALPEDLRQREPGPAVMILLEDRTAQARSEELRRDFVANASHELKTPLASLTGFIETLQGHARNDPAAADRFLGIMAAQAERMKRLVEDLISLNRIEMNEHVPPRAPMDVAEVVWEVAGALAPLADSAQAEIVVELPSRGIASRGDAAELSQVFVNLIENAIKYAGADGPIRIYREPPNPARPAMIGITVADQGEGIAREHLPRLTERFYRVDVARSRARGGTGLGLAIAKHIVNRHRGDLTVASAPGEGARFTVWLPAQAADAAA